MVLICRLLVLPVLNQHSIRIITDGIGLELDSILFIVFASNLHNKLQLLFKFICFSENIIEYQVFEQSIKRIVCLFLKITIQMR